MVFGLPQVQRILQIPRWLASPLPRSASVDAIFIPDAKYSQHWYYPIVTTERSTNVNKPIPPHLRPRLVRKERPRPHG